MRKMKLPRDYTYIHTNKFTCHFYW